MPTPRLAVHNRRSWRWRTDRAIGRRSPGRFRLSYLSAFEELELFDEGRCTIRALVGAPRVLLDACAELDVDGVVAKRVDSPYRPGIRSSNWLKLKTVDWKRGHAPRCHR